MDDIRIFSWNLEVNMRKIAFAVATLLTGTTYAHADFVVLPIAYSLFSGALGGVFSFSAIYAALGSAKLYVGGVKVQEIFKPK